MINLVLFGGPGSGKGTQSEKIVDKYGLHHISTGEVLRDHIANDTEIGRIADQYISQGHLIPDELMLRIVDDIIESHPEEVSRGVIFDGFPRTLAQAEKLDNLLAKHNMDLHKVIGLEVPDDVLTDRLLKRGEASGRADDNIDTIKERLDVYHNQTSPLREYYKNDGRYVAIDGAKSIDDIFDQIDRELEQHNQQKQ